jgi:hypothetical protein
VRAVASSGSHVYFGGNFNGVAGTSAVGGQVSATNIARFNGRSWSAVGGGVNGQVYAIAIRGYDVYAGGEFTQAGGCGGNERGALGRNQLVAGWHWNG